MTTNASKLALLLTIGVLLIIGAVSYLTRGDQYNTRVKTFRSRDGRFSITFSDQPQNCTRL